MEEIPVIYLQDLLFPRQAISKLLRLTTPLTWNLDCLVNDPTRLKKHQAKMQSKNDRAQSQVDTLTSHSKPLTIIHHLVASRTL